MFSYEKNILECHQEHWKLSEGYGDNGVQIFGKAIFLLFSNLT